MQSILRLAARRRTAGKWQGVHRAGDLRMDWTEPLLRRSAMGIVPRGDAAGMPATSPGAKGLG